MTEFRRFKDRNQAGKLLAHELREFAGRADAVVLALPRGGVPVGFAIAQRLGIELDILLVRKLGMPGHEEYAMGAVGSGGVRVLQPGVPGLLGVSAAQVEAVTARELAELERRERAYRGARAPLALAGRTAILVDDGVATGSTMLAAIRVARGLGPSALVLAVPVAPPQTLAALEGEVDTLVCLSAPPLFRSVGQWYDAFDQTSDEEVQDLLATAWHARTAARQQPKEDSNHATTADAKHDDDGHRA
ncbi:phosphoribosyltransferase [Massilia sp. LXY-6]|uniref:phosphoribosyltransferase n=1 Tax=Massilia sp. LXY-6 TaxID=3379823 RepID=UPI003EE3FC94